MTTAEILITIPKAIDASHEFRRQKAQIITA